MALISQVIDISNTSVATFRQFANNANKIVTDLNFLYGYANTKISTIDTANFATKDYTAANTRVNLLLANTNAYIATKLNSSSYTAADVLAKVLTVDGTGSGLDAEFFNGKGAGFYANAANLTTGTLPNARLDTRLGLSGKVISDWNNATDAGFYYGVSAANAPSSSLIDSQLLVYGVVEAHSSGVIVQKVWGGTSVPTASDTKTAMRTKDGSTWSAWFKLRSSETELDARYARLSANNVFSGNLSGVNATFFGTVNATGGFGGSGASLTTLNATQLTSGTVPNARISGAYSGFTTITASGAVSVGSLTTGSVSSSGSVTATTYQTSLAGSVTAPTYSFVSDPNTGMYNATTDTLGFSAGGVSRLSINTTTATFTVGISGTTGTFSGALSAGTTSLGATTTTGLTSVGNVVIQSNDASNVSGPFLILYRNSASPAASDLLADVRFRGVDSTGVATDYVRMYAQIIDPTNGSETARLVFQTYAAGTLTTSGIISEYGLDACPIGMLTPSIGNFTSVETSAVFTTDLRVTGSPVLGDALADVVYIGQENSNAPGVGNTFTGAAIVGGSGRYSTTSGSTAAIYANINSDGTLVSFRSAGVQEGAITVSVNTVTYGTFTGVHWSTLADNSKPNILRGTVVETVDQLVVWSENETNDYLPCFKISDTAGSKAVYGVFQNWHNDPEYPDVNDANIVALGTFMVRVAKGQKVSRGDLLESNGDGCARVQADDLMRSSTIAKVTSNKVIEKYKDGSYLIPCTLHCG